MCMSENDSGSTLEWLARHPLISLTSFVIGVVSLVLGIYFGVISLRSRELSYQVNRTKTAIVKSGQSSDLHILYKGQNIASDVTGLQVVVWNHGKESIRSENILTPLTLTTSPKVPILEARIKQVNRSVTQVALDTSQSANGSLGMSWKILEHNDGAVLQLIVAGPTSVTVKAEGVVEGQGQIKELETTIGKLLALLVVAVLSFLVSTAFTVRAFWRAERRFDRSRVIGANVFNTAILGVFLLVYYLGNSAVPAAFR
jgi:hypothetical protein